MGQTGRNMFLALSPLQIICAQEAREAFCKDEFNHLVLVNRNALGTVDHGHKLREIDDGWDLITHVRETKRKSGLRVPIRLWNTAKIAARHRSTRGKVFLGDALINWFAMLGRWFGDEVIWLDDGAASINVIKRFQAAGKLAAPNATTPRFFTIFASDATVAASNGAVALNTLAHLRRSAKETQTIDAERVLFIGQWLSERGGVDQDKEIATLRRLHDTLGKRQVTYIPHRHESQAKLDRIATFMTVQRFDETIERSLLQADMLPGMIMSWYSSAIFTLHRLYPEIGYQVLEVPLDDATDRQREEWLNVYQAMDEMGIHRMALDQERDAN